MYNNISMELSNSQSKLVAIRIPSELFELIESQKETLNLNTSEYIIEALRKRTRTLSKTTSVVRRSDQDIVDTISAFKEINPSYMKWYGNKTQRAAIERLLKLLGKDKLLHALEAVKQANEKPYAPTITTPCQLEDKLASLRAWFIKEHGKKELQTPKNFVI